MPHTSQPRSCSAARAGAGFTVCAARSRAGFTVCAARSRAGFTVCAARSRAGFTICVARSRAGFTILEILVVVALLAILAGAAVPLAAKALTSAARKNTRDEIALLSAASQDYFRDVGAAPSGIADLERDPGKSAPGWSGPYLPGAMSDPVAGGSSYLTDAWSRAYEVSRKSGFQITSKGQDGKAGGDDDLTIDVDFTPIRRETTLDELRTLNQAITLYNGVYQKDAPLPATWKKALAILVDKGFLPTADGYDDDAWGDAYVADPAGKTPLVKVGSANVSAKPDDKATKAASDAKAKKDAEEKAKTDAKAKKDADDKAQADAAAKEKAAKDAKAKADKEAADKAKAAPPPANGKKKG